MKNNGFITLIGKDQCVLCKTVVGFFDTESATVSESTRDFLKEMQSEMKVITLCDTENFEEPKSFVLCDDGLSESVYLTTLSSEVVSKRFGNGFGDILQ